MPVNRVKQSIRKLGLPKFFTYLFAIVSVLLAFYAYATVKSAAQSLNYALSPPELPPYQPTKFRATINQNWSAEQSDWFHYVSQGTATIPIPYRWFVNLERPKAVPWLMFFGDGGLFIADKYILRLGFIKGSTSEVNPDGLPYGFATTRSHYFSGLDRKATAVGFTCAACHTGHLTYNDTEYVIEGGPAMMDLGLFTKALGAALGQTALSSKLPFFNGRFDRFAERVLGEHKNPLTTKALKGQLLKTMGLLAKTTDTIDVREGFTRLDALNRIGNQVFSSDLDRHRNYAAIDAPVNFPHIWTAPWFDWVQYDGSIMQPLIRNSGEALGVKAYVNTTAPMDGQRFGSSVPVKNLYAIETLLAGENPDAQRGFGGLLSPAWPDDFPEIIEEKRNKGEKLYNKNCKGCHLPTLNSNAIWETRYFGQIAYTNNGVREQTKGSYLHLNIIPLSEIGTDPGQAGVLARRTVDITGLGLNTEVCTNTPSEPSPLYIRQPDGVGGELTFVPFKDSPVGNFGLALGAFVQQTNDQWMQQNYIPKKWRHIYQGERPNCLQAGMGYKARPLNGIWATAPFLHNGAIPTLFDLLSPLEDRPMFVQLGNQAFDADKVGIVQPSSLYDEIDKNCEQRGDDSVPEYEDGLFILDTCVMGNLNVGHQFEKGYEKYDKSSQAYSKGVIGPYLEESERYELIEYLKSL
jgi:hypothetical protein